MHRRGRYVYRLALALFLPLSARAQLAPQELPPRATFYLPDPLTLTVAELDQRFDSATITDVEVIEFNGDGRNDIAVAWYATDLDELTNNLRFLTLYFGSATVGFARGADIDLYIPNEQIPALSVFRNGPADIGVGDFDGDGDADLAVTPFFGDELWFVENLGGGAFAQHLKFMFGFNGISFQTPPEALAADFDQDGKDELVYIADPVYPVDPYIIHFWKTDDAIADMERVYWEGTGTPVVGWTRGLALADFNADDRPDLCFSGSVDPPQEDDPVLVFWYGLSTTSGHFAVHCEYPSFICSDVVAVQPDPLCPPGVLVTDRDGTEIEFWAHRCDAPVDFELTAVEDGYAGYAVDRGMAAAVADVDGDAAPDLITRQKLGDLEQREQVEVTLSSDDGEEWTRVDPTPVDTYGFQDLPFSETLRPHNLAVADLFGNTLPEIVAGFGPSPQGDLDQGRQQDVLRVAYWANSCVGDASRDGHTDIADLSVVLAEFGQGGQPPRDPNADLNKDGRVDLADVSIVLADYGCDCRASAAASTAVSCD